MPIYRQIVEQIGQQIACGRLNAGDRLPSVRALARSLPANQNTIIKAYETLERDGLITRKHGDGTFVTAGGPTLSTRQRRKIVGEVLAAAAMKAALFDIPPADLHRLLDGEIANVSDRKGETHD